ncbi:MAG: xanthine dehydrogenase family protein molybdopterin-binding subunit [Sneathiella sp.]|nr:xanthine dehydrogenase family protein molybdopterin-binding subunit [Sneathiella sp.]
MKPPKAAPKIGRVKIGDALPRVEDDALIQGLGQYVDDIDIGPALTVNFYRSTSATGTIESIEVADALEIEGVEAIFTGVDVASIGKLAVNPMLEHMAELDYPILSPGELKAVGEPIAAILSTTGTAGLDAIDSIYVEINQESTPRASLEDAADSAPALHQQWQDGDPSVLEMSNWRQVSTEIQHPRLAPSPMENRAIAVRYNPADDSLTVYHSTQTPHRARSELARMIGIPIEKIRVIAPDVGGAFGMKASLYPEEVFTVWAAWDQKTSTKWISTRNEDLLSATHGRGLKTKGTLYFDEEGYFKGLTANVEAPLGHWLPNSAAIPAWNAARMLPGPYNIDTYHLTTNGRSLNTGPVGIYRGAGRPEAITLLERLVDMAARSLNMNPVEIRQKNLLPAAALPTKRASGADLDSGDYRALLQRLVEETGYPTKKETSPPGTLKGTGLSFYVEPCGRGWESASVTLHTDGTVSAETGGSSQGHGRETAFRQILSDILDIEFDKIALKHGDTESCPEGIGALASRSTAIGGSALKIAAEEALAKAGGALPPTEEITISLRYENEGEAWGYGAYLAEISIDEMTGQLTVDHITCLDDAGTIINPTMVEGQIMGGIAQGIGEATMEQILYSEDGQLITGSLMDYAMPRASDMPSLSISKFQTPSPNNLLGAKGVGEAGTIAAPVAILNAAYDALEDYGVTDLQMPLTSEKIWRAMNDRREG